MRRSVLTVEIYAAVYVFEFSSTLCATFNNMFELLIPFVEYTAQQSLFIFSVVLNSHIGKCLLVDPYMLSQSY